MDTVLYIHGRGGSPEEADRYGPLFPSHRVLGLDYKSSEPWDACAEIKKAVMTLKADGGSVILIANSIGAYFSMTAGIENHIDRAFFISPIVDMEGLITNMMRMAHVSEQELRDKGAVETDFGEALSWEYLSWVREHPVIWSVSTDILYGENDDLQSRDTVKAFADRIGASFTLMQGGEHWFHTETQLAFLDNWIKEKRV